MPRRVATSVIGEMHVAGVYLHLFGDARNFACCAVTVAVTWNMTRVYSLYKVLLTSKARIPKKNTSMPTLVLTCQRLCGSEYDREHVQCSPAVLSQQNCMVALSNLQ